VDVCATVILLVAARRDATGWLFLGFGLLGGAMISTLATATDSVRGTIKERLHRGERYHRGSMRARGVVALYAKIVLERLGRRTAIGRAVAPQS